MMQALVIVCCNYPSHSHVIDDELILHCDIATEGCVSNYFFRHLLDDSPASYST